MMRESFRLLEPLARKHGLVVEEVSGEILIYDLESHHAHCLNPTAALVWKSCDGRTSVSQIAHLLAEREGTAIDIDLVWLALDQLLKSKLLTENQEVLNRVQANAVSRRQMMRRIGVGAVVALPLITSLVAPTPAQAATCLPTGRVCTTPAQCCSGLCPSGTCV
jgi:hypothetical protein